MKRNFSRRTWNNLEYWIKQLGYKKYEVAEGTNIPLRTLHDYCKRRTAIPRYRLETLAAFLGCTVSELLERPAENEQKQGEVRETKPTLRISGEAFPPATPATSSIIRETCESESQNIPAMLRRHFIQQALGLGGATSVLSSDEALIPFLERFSWALIKSSSVDETMLQYLETQTRRYWQDRQSASVASCDVLGYAWDHLQKITTLLEGSLFPSARLHLCALASKTAQLAGELLLDTGSYTQAKELHKAAIRAAQEAQSISLEAIAWGRTSLAWIYIGNIQEALIAVQKARHLAARSSHPHILAWLAAIEAECQARLFSSEACLKALDDAASIEDNAFPLEEIYLIHFDSSLLAGYQGVCYRQLYLLESPQRSFFLEQAQQALIDALGQLDPGFIQRRPTFLADLADTYFQQGEIEAVCQRATEAVTIASQIKLQKVIQRLLTLQQQLAPWKDTAYVRSLDEYIASLLGSK